MATTLADFKARVYGFINRTSTLFTTNETASIDHVLYAINDARRSAQRNYAFELNRRDVFLSTSEYGANWMTGCKLTPGGTSVLMRRPDSVWNFSTNATPAGNVYKRISRIDFQSVGDFKNEVLVDSGALVPTLSQNLVSRRKFAYLNGSNLHVTNVDTATDVLVNGIIFLDDLADGDSPDIFLTYFQDWLFWSTLLVLNQFLKDDARLNVDGVFVARLWESVKQFDGEIANAGDNARLE